MAAVQDELERRGYVVRPDVRNYSMGIELTEQDIAKWSFAITKTISSTTTL